MTVYSTQIIGWNLFCHFLQKASGEKDISREGTWAGTLQNQNAVPFRWRRVARWVRELFAFYIQARFALFDPRIFLWKFNPQTRFITPRNRLSDWMAPTVAQCPRLSASGKPAVRLPVQINDSAEMTENPPLPSLAWRACTSQHCASALCYLLLCTSSAYE